MLFSEIVKVKDNTNIAGTSNDTNYVVQFEFNSGTSAMEIKFYAYTDSASGNDPLGAVAATLSETQYDALTGDHIENVGMYISLYKGLTQLLYHVPSAKPF